MSKIRITLSVTATTFTGYILAAGELSGDLPALLTGIFLLAAGSSALNHYQERVPDSLMARTSSRPIPRGLISARKVLVISILLAAAGSALLWLFFKPWVMLLGLFNLTWYNAVYTPLKRWTAFAVLPGSVTGGIPPLIGWIAGGGNWTDPAILAVVLFFLVGQIPHFWLLLLNYGQEYEKAGLPNLTRHFTPVQINRISYAWIVATVAVSSILPALGLIRYIPYLAVYIFSSALLLIVASKHNLVPAFPGNFRRPFIALNMFYLIIMVLLIASRFS